MTDEDLALAQWDTDGGAQPADTDDEDVICQLWWRDC